MRWTQRVLPDLEPLRASRDLRLLVLGGFVTAIGTQASLVALPYQLYVQTGSALLTGLLGAVELGPLVVAALVGGALADRMDRRTLLLGNQVALVLITVVLAVLAFAGEPPLLVLYALGAALAAAGAVQTVARSAIVPNLVEPDRLPGAIAVNYGLASVAMVVGPAVGGGIIALGGVGWAYSLDGVSCFALVFAVLAIAPQPPQLAASSAAGAGEPAEAVERAEAAEPTPALGGAQAPVEHGAAPAPVPLGVVLAEIRASIADGLRFVRGKPALLGSFALDLSAMTFGMPRALFPVLSLTVYHAGAGGSGLLAAAVSAGATVAALTTGWLSDARRLGLITVVAVVAWGAAIALAGLTTSLWVAALMLALAGAADSVSAVCRSTINQSVTPDEMRGRMSSVFSLVVTSGPRLGDVESGVVAALTSARTSVVTGGIACMAAVGAVVAAFPALLAYDARQALDEQQRERDAVTGAHPAPSASPA